MNYLKELMEEEEKLFRKARNFLMDNYHRHITMDELSEETGIERRLINKWVKEGRFHQKKTMANEDNPFLDDLIKDKNKKN